MQTFYFVIRHYEITQGSEPAVTTEILGVKAQTALQAKSIVEVELKVNNHRKLVVMEAPLSNHVPLPKMGSLKTFELVQSGGNLPFLEKRKLNEYLPDILFSVSDGDNIDKEEIGVDKVIYYCTTPYGESLVITAELKPNN